MHPNAILAFFTLLALPLWALPLENDQVIVARELDHIELPRDVMYEVLDDRGIPIGALFKGARKLKKIVPHHKWVPFFFLSDCPNRDQCVGTQLIPQFPSVTRTCTWFSRKHSLSLTSPMVL
jgi:hypothetical protein